MRPRSVLSAQPLRLSCVPPSTATSERGPIWELGVPAAAEGSHAERHDSSGSDDPEPGVGGSGDDCGAESDDSGPVAG